MSKLESIFILSLLILVICYLTSKRSKKSVKATPLERFRKRFKSKNRLREKLMVELSESLMADPESNIQIGNWDREEELREKADIHRARLNKYGHSKMNGEKFYLGPKGAVYRYSSDGQKNYI